MAISSNGAPSAMTSRDLDELVARWVDRMERGPGAPRVPEEGEPSLPKCAAADDEEVAPVALEMSAQGRPRHRGTIAVRGPCSPLGALRHGELDDAQVKALEFVAAWFGAPYDGVNLRGVTLSWGVWHFAGDALGFALALFKERAPVPFAATLGRHGVDVVVQREGERVVAGALTTTAPSRAPLTGPAAHAAVGANPLRVAALARAAREPPAREAQLEALVRAVALPSLAVPVPAASRGAPGARRLADLLLTPRHVAVAYLAELAHGPAGVAELARSLATSETTAGGAGVERALLRHAAGLERAGRGGEATRLRRTLASPELAG